MWTSVLATCRVEKSFSMRRFWLSRPYRSVQPCSLSLGSKNGCKLITGCSLRSNLTFSRGRFYSVLKSSGTSPNFLITLQRMKVAVLVCFDPRWPNLIWWWPGFNSREVRPAHLLSLFHRASMPKRITPSLIAAARSVKYFFGELSNAFNLKDFCP
jgi:hypothetical protein